MPSHIALSLKLQINCVDFTTQKILKPIKKDGLCMPWSVYNFARNVLELLILIVNEYNLNRSSVTY